MLRTGLGAVVGAESGMAALASAGATPAWTVERSPEKSVMGSKDAFDLTTDERTMARLRRRDQEAGMMTKMKSRVEEAMHARGITNMISQRGVYDFNDEAPVLKPRKGMRYHFTA
ncbi:hypothetical protein LTR62_007830 [Meristemomyces frigidus]|uniref:Uncharacterized protein n=1 Tax=Meristemomyces frigidus TaxID=1508187 RepID=A0AAN7TII4_9PEZI|nr:hypothetical protein LTR62_007830 [Meristemomyces frigidus]